MDPGSSYSEMFPKIAWIETSSRILQDSRLHGNSESSDRRAGGRHVETFKYREHDRWKPTTTYSQVAALVQVVVQGFFASESDSSKMLLKSACFCATLCIGPTAWAMLDRRDEKSTLSAESSPRGVANNSMSVPDTLVRLIETSLIWRYQHTFRSFNCKFHRPRCL